MIYGLFLDPRSWKIDITSSQYWCPEKYGVKIDLCQDAFNIPRKGISSKYKFVIASEVWEIPLRKALKYLRQRGVKIFLLPREPLKSKIFEDAMFSYKKFYWDGECYFAPDAVFAAGQAYADLWKYKTHTYITGYPRFDYYVNNKRWMPRHKAANKYGLDLKKKWIFFPDYPPYHYAKIDGKDTMVDLFDARENTLKSLEQFALMNKEYQVVVKIHPASMKPFKKGTGKGNEVKGKLLERYKSPTSAMKVIGDIRESGLEAKELLTNADIVCGFSSTMLLEAAIIGKPAIHILFGNAGGLEGIPEFASHMPVAHNDTMLYGLLKASKSVFVQSTDMAEKYLHKTDGLSCKRICKSIRKEFGQ